MSGDRLTFKEMCAKFDVTPRTLRYYEYIELLSPEREGRSRFYSPRETARMTLILRGRRFGFSLEEIPSGFCFMKKKARRRSSRNSCASRIASLMSWPKTARDSTRRFPSWRRFAPRPRGSSTRPDTAKDPCVVTLRHGKDRNRSRN